MLCGIEMEQLKWQVKEHTKGDRYLQYEGIKYSQQYYFDHVIKKIEKYGRNIDDLFIYVFSQDGLPRFAFFSEEEISYTMLDNSLFRFEEETCFLVKGALYDIKKDKFITFYRKNPFLEYVIHDAGIPSTIYDEEKYFFMTMFFGPKEKVKYISTAEGRDPRFVTRAYYKKDIGAYVLYRTIFMVDDRGDNIAIVLSDDINCDFILDDVSFSTIKYLRDKMDSEKEYFAHLHQKEDSHIKDTFITKRYGYFCNKHISTSDAIIVRDPSGQFGNLNLIRFNNGKHLYDKRSSFVACDKFTPDPNGKFQAHNILRVVWRKNDYENGYAYEDITTGETYENLSEYAKAETPNS